MKRVIEDTDELKCPSCLTSKQASVWDEDTKGKCLTRQQRRDYVSICEKRTTFKATEIYYYCKKCDQWILGHILHKNKVIKTVNKSE